MVIQTMMVAGDRFVLSDRITSSTDAIACKHRFHLLVEDLVFQTHGPTQFKYIFHLSSI